MIEILGWIGCFLLAICGIPQAYTSYKTKSSDGVSGLFIMLWGVGEIFTLVYALALESKPLLMNYVVNLICITVIAYYKFRVRR